MTDRHAGSEARRLTAALFIVAALLASTPALLAQGADDVDGVDLAPVTLDGRQLFRVPAVAATRAVDRAAAISDRIAQVAADPAVSPDDVRVIDEDGLLVLQAGDVRLLAVTEQDGKLVGTSPAVIARFVQGQIASGIRSFREERSPRALLEAAGRALAATIVFLVLLWLASRGVRWLESRAASAFQARIEHLPDQTLRIVRSQRFDSLIVPAMRLLRFALWLLLTVPFVHYTFNLFPWTRPISANLRSILLGPVETMSLGLVQFIPSFVFLVVLFVVVRIVLRITRASFEAIEQGTLTVRNFDPEWAQPTFRIARMLIVAFAVIVGYPYLPGSGSEAFKGVSLFLGVVFSLASSSALANIIAGYSLTYRRAFRVGDVIRIGDDFGTVMIIRLQVTHVRTMKNEEIIIPNSTVLTSNVVNYSRLAAERGLILHAEVGIGYETPWRQVHAMLLEAAARTEGLKREPPPFVFQKRLGDFAVTYEVNVYCDAPGRQAELYSRLHQNILDVFNEHGVQIMTPAYEGDPPEPKVVAKSDWFRAPARESE